MSSKGYELVQLAKSLVVNDAGTITDLNIDTTNIDSLVNIDLAIAPEVLEIQVDAPDAGQSTIWKWTWEQSTLPYARRTITNSNELNVPVYKEGTYVVNNFAAYDIHGSMTQTHSLYLKWIDGAGTDNLVSWATSAGPISDTHPSINGGAATDVQRITVNVPATITIPTLTNPSVAYTVVNSGSGSYTFSGAASGDNPNLGPFYRGGTYTINITATGHPFYFTTDNGTNFSAGTYFGEYTSGVTGSRNDTGSVTFTVPANAPDTLYYQCGNHSPMRGGITVKDLAVETNINGNYVVYFQHTQEGHKTPVELRPIPALVNQMCIVYDATSGKFVPQDLATYVENTPSFENKIREVAGTAELVVADGSAVIAKVTVYDDSTYLPLTGNNAGDQAFATDTDILYIWDGSAWQQAGASNSDDLTEGSSNLFFTNERVDDRVSALLIGGNNITATYDDTAGTLTLDGQPGYTNSDVGTYLTTNGYDTATNIVASITDSAPATLDTLNELAAALGDDPNFATTVSTNISTKLATADFTSTANTWIGTKNTDDLTEGSANLYYTDARADARITASDTDALSEGTTNLYYTQGRFDSAFATKISSDVTFGADVSADLVNATLLIQDDTIPNGTTYTIPSGKQVVVDSLDIIGDLDVLGTLATVSGGSLTQTTMKTQAITHTNGTNAINISTGGNVGIGTDNPTNLLHVKSTANNGGVITIESTATDSYPFLRLKNDAREYQITAHGPLSDIFTIYDGTAGSHRLVISSSGNVGIGETSPDYRLEVKGTATTNTDIVGFSNSNGVAKHIFGLENVGAGRYSILDGSNNTAVFFSAHDADNSYINAGNVGIGTVSPYKALTITRPFGTSRADLLDLQSSVGGGGTAPLIRFGTWSANSNTIGRIGFVDEPSYGGEFVVETNSSGSATDTTTEKFRITKDGNVNMVGTLSFASSGLVSLGSSSKQTIALPNDGGITIGSGYTFANIYGTGGNLHLRANSYIANTGTPSEIILSTASAGGGSSPDVTVKEGYLSSKKGTIQTVLNQATLYTQINPVNYWAEAHSGFRVSITPRYSSGTKILGTFSIPINPQGASNILMAMNPWYSTDGGTTKTLLDQGGSGGSRLTGSHAWFRSSNGYDYNDMQNHIIHFGYTPSATTTLTFGFYFRSEGSNTTYFCYSGGNSGVWGWTAPAYMELREVEVA